MKNKYLLITVLFLGIVAFGSSNKNTTSFLDEEKDKTISVYDPNKKSVEDLKLEEYVMGVVSAEMPASFNEEALKAQAIASRTYAVYKMENTKEDFDVIADISNQAYITVEEMKNKWKEDFDLYFQKVKNAVLSTKNVIMTYEGNAIESFYFAMSNGMTEESQLVFGENKEYLGSVDSSWDKNVKNFVVINTISKEEFCTKLNIQCSDVLFISNVKKSLSGRINTIDINGKSFKGTEVRQLLNLRSTDFEITLGDKIEITTKGYGHGVGMSQYGANEMAKLGYKFEEILKYYYQNIELSTLNV